MTEANAHEQKLRERNARQLIDTFVGRHGEFFADPQNRLDFITSQTPLDFIRLAEYVNAKLRGEKPHELRQLQHSNTGALPKFHTPMAAEKPAAFTRGYEAVQDYLTNTDDPMDKKIEGAAMAAEALLIWVHPFADGNGRTGRFLGKLIEDGTADMDGLVAQTVSSANRPRAYYHRVRSNESLLEAANDIDLMIEDDERDGLYEAAKSAPHDVEAIGLSVEILLRHDELRQRAYLHK